MMATSRSSHLLSLPLELLETCHRIKEIITSTIYLEYILYTEMNTVDDLLPPDVPLRKRVELLKLHERSWSDLQFNILSEFAINGNVNSYRYTLQDGYLIYSSVTDREAQYGYVDLYSLSPNEQTRGVLIPLENVRFPLDILFAADHNLAVVISQQGSNSCGLYELDFFQFTTGEPHPLLAFTTAQLPPTDSSDLPKVHAEVFGNYILMALMYRYGRFALYVVSWRTGIVTQFRDSADWPSLSWSDASKLVVIDRNLFALVTGLENSLEICKLEHDPLRAARLETMCFLKLPPFILGTRLDVSFTSKEWVPTSEHHGQSQSSSRERHVPFRSSRLGTVNLLLKYHKGRSVEGDCTYLMTVSVSAMISAACSNARHVPWENWGPAGTRIFPLKNFPALPIPAGPFWITGIAGISLPEVRDYDMLRTLYMFSSSPSSSTFSSTRLVSEYWVAGEVETHLPYRRFVSKEPKFRSFHHAVADREWVVTITSLLEHMTCFTVYRVG